MPYLDEFVRDETSADVAVIVGRRFTTELREDGENEFEYGDPRGGSEGFE